MPSETKISFYQAMLRKLFPQGRLWTFPVDGVLDNLLAGVATEFARVDEEAQHLLLESDPRTTTQLISEWEEFLGLPDDCSGLAVTLADRRNQVVSKLLLRGPQNKAFYVQIAQTLGYDISVDDIEEFDVLRAGFRAGDRARGLDWAHAFALNIPEFTTRVARAGSMLAGDRLVEFGDDLLECLITAQKPAHAEVIFQYV